MDALKRSTFDVKTEPTGALYGRLLEQLLTTTETFILVTRSEVPLSDRAGRLLTELIDFQLAVSEESKWPGTELFGHTAIVRRYRCGSGALSTLSRPGRLFGWVQPDLPEDPCFFRADGSVLLTTIAHERDAFFELTEAESAQLLQAVPGLRICKR